ncbi:hypothetical protein C361_00501 [Cryptococcus neoformans Tu259-1]|uniref:Uncharacterized protein n=1 Tax=Cryptococcus neoformans Tu259-1 TaxID=1230072 RepID=A0A854QQW1_CRYNE|nr:hypothetical protein C361_00501 [Cryptococcus neoformans var. grubii Tu259-1]
MQYPRVNRYPDNVLVRLPAYYADHGGPGWYPELQSPHQTRLAMRYSSALRKDVYIQPNALFIPGIKEELGMQGIREILYSLGVERGLEFTMYRPLRHLSGLVMTTIQFPSQRQAEDVLITVNKNNHLFVSSTSELKARYHEINSRGVNAASTKDILLVREELSLAPAYIPTIVPPHLAHLLSFQPARWNAVGYARDAFVNKRKLTEYDHDLYPLVYGHLHNPSDKRTHHHQGYDRMGRCGPYDRREVPSPRKKRFLAHDFLPSSLHKYEDIPKLHYDDYQVSSHLTESAPESALQYGRKSPDTRFQNTSADYSQLNSTLRSTLWSIQQPPKKKVKRRKILHKTKYALDMGIGSHVGNGTVRPGINAQRKRTFVSKGLSTLTERNENQIGGENQTPAVLEWLRQTAFGNEGNAEPLATTAEILAFNQAEQGQNLACGGLLGWNGKAKAALDIESQPQLGTLPQTCDINLGPPRPSCSAASPFIYSDLQPFTTYFCPFILQRGYCEPKFIALSNDRKTLYLMERYDPHELRRFSEVCAIDALSEDQRKLLGLERRWTMNGQAEKMWGESEKGVVQFRAPE